MLCGHLRRRCRDIFTGRRKSSQLIIAASWHELYALDTSYCSVCNRGWIICAKTIILDLVRQMKEAVEQFEMPNTENRLDKLRGGF